MKKYYIILLFQLLFSSVYAQTGFNDFLSRLNMSNKDTLTFSESRKVVDSLNFDLVKTNSDLVYKHPQKDLELLFIKLKVYKGVSIYGVLSTESPILSMENLTMSGINSFLVIDDNEKLIYILMYNNEGSPISSLENNKYVIQTNFQSNLNQIVLIDKNFEPISSVLIDFDQEDLLKIKVSYIKTSDKWSKSVNDISFKNYYVRTVSYNNIIQILLTKDVNGAFSPCNSTDDYYFFINLY
ncbi:hypothetical protein [Neptunitalea lumnitzerae]|nr:hypothetical protein [Neptunitalea sp. Y10]